MKWKVRPHVIGEEIPNIIQFVLFFYFFAARLPTQRPCHTVFHLPFPFSKFARQRMTATWTPEVVEDLLFRQFMKGEDVSAFLPRTPETSATSGFFCDSEALSMACKYVDGGTALAVATNVVNTGKFGVEAMKVASNVPSALGTPSKKSSTPTPTPKTPTAKQPASKAATQLPPRTPKAGAAAPCIAPEIQKQEQPRSATPTPTNANGVKRERSDARTPTGKKVRIEWPAAVPGNDALKVKDPRTVSHLTTARIAAQDGVDPDLIFSQPIGDFPLEQIFHKYPQAVQKLGNRGMSGNWTADTFTADEECRYKREMHFVHTGPSQVCTDLCRPPSLF